MTGNPVFDQYASDYDHWFDTHPEIYATQLALLRTVIPNEGTGLEIGTGAGRFASCLGIGYGIDPSPSLLTMARQRGVESVQGLGEFLPYRTGMFDNVLMMTVICFLEDLDRSFREAYRVLRLSGKIVIGFLEKDGEIALREQGRKSAGRFLQHATFRSVNEVTAVLEEAGFSHIAKSYTLHGFCIVTAQKD